MTPLKNRHTWLALAAAAVVAVPPYIFVGLLIEPCGGVSTCAAYASVLAAVVLQFAGLVAVFIGLPVYLVFRRCRLYSWWQYALGGLGIALIVGAMFGVNSKDLAIAITFGFMGVVAASTFWAMAPWRHEL